MRVATRFLRPAYTRSGSFRWSCRIDPGNRLTAVIQNECTAIHPSVAWKFNEEAERFIQHEDSGKETHFREISFDNLVALYGEIDIAGSSSARAEAISKDLLCQIDMIKNILGAAQEIVEMPLLKHLLYQTQIIAEIRILAHQRIPLAGRK